MKSFVFGLIAIGFFFSQNAMACYRQVTPEIREDFGKKAKVAVVQEFLGGDSARMADLQVTELKISLGMRGNCHSEMVTASVILSIKGGEQKRFVVEINKHTWSKNGTMVTRDFDFVPSK